ncbi:hypothetical protein PLANPX_4358 [Lacipirellula parvula]|uniref:Uncharacterized protein n=1 Tax=Lacipirellula parvula TaxID=2650471 RepID=A0A5K7XJZ0_9BACT|nr:hypothetical protein PLANPX_4358 [Lacipirellula parvula]
MSATSCVDFLLEANRRKIHTHVCFNPSRNVPAALPIEAFVVTMPERTAENPGHM